MWITENCGKFLKGWEYQTTRPASWEICMEVKKQQLELDMEQQTCPKLGKDYVNVVYCHPAYLTYKQSTSFKMLGWMKHKLESRLLGEISITSDMQMIPPSWQKVKRNKRASWWRWKRKWKSRLKTQHSINQDHSIWFNHFIENRWGNNGNSDRLSFWSSKITADADCSHEIKNHLLLGRKLWPI